MRTGSAPMALHEPCAGSGQQLLPTDAAIIADHRSAVCTNCSRQDSDISKSGRTPTWHKLCCLCYAMQDYEGRVTMSATGVGNVLSSLGPQYNFKSMTNAQFLSAVNNLGSQGKISQAVADQLSAVAQGVDYVPINGASTSVSQTLSDPTLHNFIAEIQGDDSSANQPGAVGGSLYDRMLQALQSYQGSVVENSPTSPSVEA
jgi:hypothetical protein